MTAGEQPQVRDRDQPPAAPRPAGFSAAALARYYRRQFASALAANLAYRGAVGIWVVTSVMEDAARFDMNAANK